MFCFCCLWEHPGWCSAHFAFSNSERKNSTCPACVEWKQNCKPFLFLNKPAILKGEGTLLSKKEETEWAGQMNWLVWCQCIFQIRWIDKSASFAVVGLKLRLFLERLSSPETYGANYNFNCRPSSREELLRVSENRRISLPLCKYKLNLCHLWTKHVACGSKFVLSQCMRVFIIVDAQSSASEWHRFSRRGRQRGGEKCWGRHRWRRAHAAPQRAGAQPIDLCRDSTLDGLNVNQDSAVRAWLIPALHASHSSAQLFFSASLITHVFVVMSGCDRWVPARFRFHGHQLFMRGVPRPATLFLCLAVWKKPNDLSSIWRGPWTEPWQLYLQRFPQRSGLLGLVGVGFSFRWEICVKL